MKYLILTLWIVIFFFFSSYNYIYGNEYVTEEVCKALSGCWVDTKTGECPDCVMERREVTHTHEEEPVSIAFKTPVYSSPSLINFEKCATHVRANGQVVRDEFGCELHLWTPQQRADAGYPEPGLTPGF